MTITQAADFNLTASSAAAAADNRCPGLQPRLPGLGLGAGDESLRLAVRPTVAAAAAARDRRRGRDFGLSEYV